MRKRRIQIRARFTEKQIDGEKGLSTPTLRSKLRLTIGTKIVGLIASLLLGSVVVLVMQSTNMFIEDNTALIQQMNSDTAGSLATRIREEFQDVTDKMRMLGTVMMQESVPPEVRERVTREFFSKDKDFLAVLIHRGADSPSPAMLPAALSPELGAIGDADGVKLLAELTAEKDFSLPALSRGAIQLVPFHLADGSSAIAVGVPFIAAETAGAGAPSRFTHTLTAVIRQSKFLKAVADSDIITSYLVDQKGRLLAHPDTARAAATEDVSQVGIVRIMLEGKTGNGQTRYQDPQSGEWRLGSYKLVGFGGLGMVSEVPEAKAFEAAQGVKRRSMYWALIILSLAFLAGYLFSNTIANRIKTLVEAAREISQGNFAIDLKPGGGDEVATLAVAFNDMAKGLEERDRVKETFNKFHNKEIADKLLSGEVKLGGERKEATIFFSDVRGFTAMSESMEPEQVVEMLNEYMTRMVSIIRSHNGIVDKYVGDAIMAIWGVPLGGPDDAENAVKACLAMRSELAALNELRLSRGQNALRIGMGLNTGSVIAGNIGSNEKMEYTVIGDSVNLASRMESMTKEYGADLLVPKVIQERLEGRYIFEQCKSAKVKGKSQAIEIFKVKGYVDESGNPILIETPYSSYEAEKSDKVVHDEPNVPEAPPKMSEGWFVQLGDEPIGPFSEKEICSALQSREFTPETLISHHREGPWLTLRLQPEFTLVTPAAAAATAPAPAPERASTIIPARPRVHAKVVAPPVTPPPMAAPPAIAVPPPFNPPPIFAAAPPPIEAASQIDPKRKRHRRGTGKIELNHSTPDSSGETAIALEVQPLAPPGARTKKAA